MITRTGIHAVTALAALAKLPRGAYGGAAAVALQIGAPRNYLGKLLKTLADHGLLQSQKGKRGGFRLAKHPDAISLFDVIDAIDPLSRWSGCFLGRKRCSNQAACPLHKQWKKVRQAYLDFLEQTNVADLVR